MFNDPSFDSDKNLILINKPKQGKDYIYSTTYTLCDLEYDIDDIVDVLKHLTIKDYSETKIDKDDNKPLTLFVFGKHINQKLVYIKIKIKELENIIVCVSFHYAKSDMEFPYTVD